MLDRTNSEAQMPDKPQCPVNKPRTTCSHLRSTNNRYQVLRMEHWLQVVVPPANKEAHLSLVPTSLLQPEQPTSPQQLPPLFSEECSLVLRLRDLSHRTKLETVRMRLLGSSKEPKVRLTGKPSELPSQETQVAQQSSFHKDFVSNKL